MTFLEWLTSDAVVAVLIKALQVFLILLTVVICGAWLTWGERRLLAVWQDRYGPNRVWVLGLGIVIADMVKAFFKEDWTPSFVDKATFIIAPVISFASPILIFAAIPITAELDVLDMNLGLLYFLAVASLSIYAVMLAGWSSNNKYALLGGVRSAAQMLSYEVFMGIALMGVVILAGSFSLRDIVIAQEGAWYVFKQPLGFFLFIVAAIATTHRTPFDLPEAEHELTAGYHTEYSSLKFAMFMLSEYVGVVMAAAMITVLYFGGWLGPGLPPLLWFIIKVFFFCGFIILVRAALPRPRYDQFMAFGWKLMLPLSLLNVLATGGIVLWLEGG